MDLPDAGDCLCSFKSTYTPKDRKIKQYSPARHSAPRRCGHTELTAGSLALHEAESVALLEEERKTWDPVNTRPDKESQ
jgi:hypothetical protein